MAFWLQLFDTSDFPARWTCGRWTAGHGWLHILSDIGVWSAYFAIPCVLLYFIWRRKDLPFRRIFLLFGAFILLCGTTHLMEAIIFWWPAYRLAGVIKLLTALVSWVTVIALMGVVPKVLLLKSPEELEQEVKKCTAELAAATSRLQQSEERLRLAVEATGVGIFDYDPATNKQVMSEQAMEIWGFSTGSDTSGKAVLSAVHPDDRERVRAATAATCVSSPGDSDTLDEGRFAVAISEVIGDVCNF
jgi:PAS domain-containing protein